jgi:hypothetical protein
LRRTAAFGYELYRRNHPEAVIVDLSMRGNGSAAHHRRSIRKLRRKIADITGRVCIVRNIKVEAGAIFSIEEKDLTSCDR